MRWVFLDIESYYDTKEYTLRKMTPIEYAYDGRFEMIGCAVIDGGSPFWLEGEKVIDYLRRLSPEECAYVSHNLLFDGCMFAYRYGLYPRLYVDTMSMARALLSHVLPRGRVSLDNVGGFLGVGQKTGALANASGMRLADLKTRPAFYQSYIEYALNDVAMCKGIFERLKHQFPPQEYLINDAIVRMATRPQFAINETKLHGHLSSVVNAKQTLLDRVGIGKDELMSNEKFALALQRLGVNPPTKISPTTGKETWAFAKTDAGMEELEEHPDPDVQALHAARVGLKSTIEETRTQRFINIARATYEGNKSWMPVPLKFSGAHTHRFSGDWKLNLQNLGRGSLLREALEAPDDEHVVLTCDAAQIEARLNAWICKQQNLVDAFARKEDVYSLFATDMYGVTVTKADKPKRLGGKISILGLGFQMGPPKFQTTWRIQSAAAGMPTELDIIEAQRVVSLYRNKYSRIRDTWHWLQDMIPRMANGSAKGEMFGPCVFEEQAIRLPSGLRLFYHDLHQEGSEWVFTYAGKRKKIYGGKLLENVIQALDRICVMEADQRIQRRCARMGISMPLAHQVHDEVIYVPRREWLPEIQPMVEEEMRRPPEWGLDLPLDAESGVGPNYGEAK